MDLNLRLAERLRGALGHDAIDARGAAWTVRGVAPLCAVSPATEEEVGIALRVLAEAGAATIVWGGGTQIEVGAVPGQYDCALSLARLDRVVEHAPADLTATVQAGATLAQVQSALRGARQRLCVDAPWAARATIGGLHASGTVGPRTHDLGSLRTMVVGAEAYTSAGTLFHSGGRVVKNVTGYDLHRVLFRSWGSLAVLTRLHVRLVALPESECVVVARFGSPEDAFAAAERVRGMPTRPVGLAVLCGLEGETPATVLAGWEGSDADVAEACGHAAPAWERARTCDALHGDAVSTRWASAAAAQVGNPLHATARLRIAVPPLALAGMWKACERLDGVVARGALAYSDRGILVAHLRAGSADGEGEGEGSEATASARSWIARLRVAAQAAGGSLVALAPGATSPEDVWGPPPAHLPLLRRVKEAWDPERRLAPGRLVGGL